MTTTPHRPAITLVEGTFRKLSMEQTLLKDGANIIFSSPNLTRMTDPATPSVTVIMDVRAMTPAEASFIKHSLQADEDISVEGMPLSPDTRKFSEGSVNSDTEFDMNGNSKGMVKSHYVDKAGRTSCTNRLCQKRFSVKRRPRHCRRCGEVFCIKCLTFRRRLNRIAHPDPAGTPRKVCYGCFHEDAYTYGCSRKLTAEFLAERTMARHARTVSQRVASLTTTFWRDQLNIESECMRLVDGFTKAVGNSETKRTLHELKHIVKPPQWQNSDHRKSPTTEPAVSLLLHVCSECKSYISSQQARDERWFMGHGVRRAVSELEIMDGTFAELQTMIHGSLSKCEDLLTTYEEKDTQQGSSPLTSPDSLVHGTHHSIFIQIPAIMENLVANMEAFGQQFKKLKHLMPTMTTRTQQTMLLNYSKGKYDFFMESKNRYRHMKKWMMKLNIDSIHKLPANHNETLNAIDETNANYLENRATSNSLPKRAHNEEEAEKKLVRRKASQKLRGLFSKHKNNEQTAVRDNDNDMQVPVETDESTTGCIVIETNNNVLNMDLDNDLVNDNVFVEDIDNVDLSSDDNLDMEINTISVQWSRRSSSK